MDGRDRIALTASVSPRRMAMRAESWIRKLRSVSPESISASHGVELRMAGCADPAIATDELSNSTDGAMRT